MERGPLAGRAQEWNISRKELEELVRGRRQPAGAGLVGTGCWVMGAGFLSWVLGIGWGAELVGAGCWVLVSLGSSARELGAGCCTSRAALHHTAGVL